MQNLREKLLKAGMVSKEEASKAEAEASKPKPRPPPPQNTARPASRPERPSRPSKPSHAPARARPPAREARETREAPIPKLPPLPGSKEFQRQESMKQRELDRQLRELVMPNQVPIENGTHTFYFVTRKGRLRRMEMSEAQAKRLEEGQLAVVERQDPDKIEHALVLPEIAERMHALLAKSVRFFNKEGAPVGFISEDELKTRQADEKAHEEKEAQATPTATEGETWIAVKRADAPAGE